MNCGIVRDIGQAFPSGNTEPGVHPNCECQTEGVLPGDNTASLIIIGTLLAVMLQGQDWSGQ
jgi:hypothetical protein